MLLVARAQDTSCRTTASTNPARFVPPSPYDSPTEPRGAVWYGTPRLWTQLPLDGSLGSGFIDGVYRSKMFFWREGYNSYAEPNPAIVVTARRLDANDRTVTVRTASHARAADIGQAMVMLVDVPSTGCWQFTAQYAAATLTFVVSVP